MQALLGVEFCCLIGQSVRNGSSSGSNSASKEEAMAHDVPSKKPYHDEWGDTRIGYEDRTAVRPMKASRSSGGNKFLGSIGSFLIVAGILWATYLLTSGKLDTSQLMNFPGPLHVCVAGVIVALISRLLR
jgi:hypothetical protein